MRRPCGKMSDGKVMTTYVLLHMYLLQLLYVARTTCSGNELLIPSMLKHGLF
jgi:hypothetical protein